MGMALQGPVLYRPTKNVPTIENGRVLSVEHSLWAGIKLAPAPDDNILQMVV